MVANAGSDKSWVWNAFDFSEGELVEKMFAIRFGTPDNAQEFKAKFEEAQKLMTDLLSGADAAGAAGDKAAEEAAAAVEGLKVEEAPAQTEA